MTNILHPFEAAGLGLAPFRFLGLTDMGKVARGCEYCGTGIRYACRIQSADGRTFVVGTDCVLKTSTETDTTLALDVRRAIAEQEAEKREAKREAAHQRLMARVESARQDLAAHPWLFANLPHPHAYHASQGKTLRDYYEWMLRHGGATGRESVCKAVEKSFDPEEATV